MQDDQTSLLLARLKPSADRLLQQVLGDDVSVDKLQDTYDHRLEQIGAAITDVSAYTKANPWLALGAAFGSGLLIGRLKGSRKRKITYVRKIKPEEMT